MPSYLILRGWHANKPKRFVVATRAPIENGCELLDTDGRIVARASNIWPDDERPGWMLARFDLQSYGLARHPNLRRHLFEHAVVLVHERPAVARIAPPLKLADLPPPPSSEAASYPWQPRTAVVVPFPTARA